MCVCVCVCVLRTRAEKKGISSMCSSRNSSSSCSNSSSTDSSRSNNRWPESIGEFNPYSTERAFDTLSHQERDKRNANGDFNAVIDLLILVDNAIYREVLQNYGSHKLALVKLKTYYTMLASLVSRKHSIRIF